MKFKIIYEYINIFQKNSEKHIYKTKGKFDFKKRKKLNMATAAFSSVKILVIGPLQSGKSTITNLLSERTEGPSNYRPTVGVRILEFEKQAPRNPKRPGLDKVMIELWDVSGDMKFVYCLY